MHISLTPVTGHWRSQPPRFHQEHDHRYFASRLCYPHHRRWCRWVRGWYLQGWSDSRACSFGCHTASGNSSLPLTKWTQGWLGCGANSCFPSPHGSISSVCLGLAIVPQDSVDGRYTSQEPARNTRPSGFHCIRRSAWTRIRLRNSQSHVATMYVAFMQHFCAATRWTRQSYVQIVDHGRRGSATSVKKRIKAKGRDHDTPVVQCDIDGPTFWVLPSLHNLYCMVNRSVSLRHVGGVNVTVQSCVITYILWTDNSLSHSQAWFCSGDWNWWNWDQ